MRKAITPAENAFIVHLYHEYSRILESYGRRYVGYQTHFYPAVEDAVQDTFESVMKHIDDLMEHENVAAWLRVTFKNYLVRELQKRHIKKEVSYDILTDNSVVKKNYAAVIDDWDSKITLNDVKEAAAVLLADTDQKVFEEHFLNGYTAQETAERLGISKDAVRGRIGRIRCKLKNFFQIYFSLCALLMLNRII